MDLMTRIAEKLDYAREQLRLSNPAIAQQAVWEAQDCALPRKAIRLMAISRGVDHLLQPRAITVRYTAADGTEGRATVYSHAAAMRLVRAIHPHAIDRDGGWCDGCDGIERVTLLGSDADDAAVVATLSRVTE